MSSRARHKHSIGVKRDPVIYDCTHCNYRTRSETGIKLHRKKSHKIESNTIEKETSLNQCEACGETFENLEEIIKHVKLCHRQT